MSTLRSVAGLTLARSAVPLGLFVSTVAVGRVLHAEALGTYAAVTAVAQIVIWGCGAGFPLMTLRDITAGRASSEYLNRVLATFFFTSLPALLALTLIYAVVGRDLILVQEVILAGVSSCLFNAMYIVSAANSARQAFGVSALGESIGGITFSVLSVGAVVGGWGIRGALLAACVAWGVATILMYRLNSEHATKIGPESLLSLFRRQMPYLLYGLVNGSYSRLDSALLRAVAGPAVTGVYAAGYRLLGPFSLVGSAFAYVFLGKASGYGIAWTGEWVSTVRRTQLYFSAIMSCAALVGLWCAPAVLQLLFGQEYAASGTVARLLMLSVIPFGRYLPLVHALNTADERKELFRIFAIPTLLDATVVVTLGARWGAIAAAAAWVASETILLAIVEVRFRHLERTRALVFATIPPRT